MRYELPPGQNKKDLTQYDTPELLHQFSLIPNEDIPKAIMQCWQGISPILAREIALAVTGGLPLTKKQLIAVHEQRLAEQLDRLKALLSPQNPEETVLYMASEQNHKPKDFTVLPIRQYGDYLLITTYHDTGSLLDAFYGQRDKMDRMRQRSNDLLKFVINRMERVTKKIALWEEELLQSANRDVLREYGDLLNANLWKMEKGMTSVTLENFYDEMKEITIALDPRLTPPQNAQRYYTEYRKAATAEQKITELMVEAKAEETYLDSVWDLITRCESEAELQEIRQELVEQGFIKRAAKDRGRADKVQPPMKFITSDGFTVYCGRNNKQNDKLTLKDARNYDLWLHTQKIPGSHVVIVADGKTIPDRSIEEAAVIAAYHSRGRDSAQVPVDYTLIRNVKKPRGAKPGMVIFVDYKTAYVTPDEALVNALRAKDR
jgi:predicted ribosome quality control (RQC) complex YloA/Tae2 family protein